eukprot:12847691-Alexandrium_andersonii.AAC.1
MAKFHKEKVSATWRCYVEAAAAREGARQRGNKPTQAATHPPDKRQQVCPATKNINEQLPMEK